MFVFLNGEFVPEQRAVVSVFDRSFLYGDGLFETVRILNGKPFRWTQHLQRLEHGAGLLKIKIPFTPDSLRAAADRLILENQMRDSLLRLTLSRGVGVRGYSPKGAEHPILVMSLHPPPALQPPSPAGVAGPASGFHPPSPACAAEAALASAEPPAQPGSAWRRPVGRERAGVRVSFPTWKLITASPRLPAGETLAQFKTCNKLPQILARAEADAAGADEALLLNTDGNVVEGTGSNLFWIERDVVCTPSLGGGILAGVTRAIVLEICRSLGVQTHEGNLTPPELHLRQGVFLTLSTWGIVEACALDGKILPTSPLPARLVRAYDDLVRAETA